MISETTDIGIVPYQPCEYRVQRTPPTIGSSTYTFGQSNGLIQFEVTAGVINFSKICIQGTLTLVPTAGNVAIYPSNYFPLIQRLECTNAGGADLCSLMNADKYTKGALPLMLDYQDRSNIDGALFQSYRTSKDSTVISMAASDYYLDTDATGQAAFAQQVQSLTEYSNYDLVIPYGGDVTQANQQYIRNQSWNLGKIFSDTIFAIDHDFNFKSSIYIKIYMSTLSKVGLSFPVAGAQFGAGLVSAQLTNLGMLTYYQANPVACATAEAESDAGFVLAIPYTTNMNTVFTGNSQQSTFHISGPSQNALNRLYKVHYNLFLPDNTSGIFTNLTNSSNLAIINQGAANQIVVPKIYSQVTLNATARGQVLIIDAARNEDYAHTKNMYGKTSFTSESAYKICGVIPYVFDSEPALKHYTGNQIIGEVMPNGSYDLNANFTVPMSLTNNTLDHHIFATIFAICYFKNGRSSFSPIP